MSSSFPSGTVTFLFTDIEGSTRLRQAQPEAYKEALARHNELLTEAIEGQGGAIFKIIGDAFCAAFATAPAAMRAALDAQHALHAAEWGAAPLRVRMALHTGAAELRDGDYWGFTLARMARLLPAGHGGQVLVSQATADLLADELPVGLRLRDQGEHRLKDLVRAEHIFQLVAPELPEIFPALKTLDAYPHNLPVQLTSFIGRGKEIAEVKRLMSATRLLTLVGPGGTGKTRLALQLAAEELDRFADGAWVVELAPLADPNLVPHSVATTLGLRESSERPVLTALADYLRDKTLLLVLDNCEHLLDACARLADHLLHAAPRLRILASSREGLGIAGEATYPVPSLALPNLNQLPPFETLDQFEAVRLFIERAVAAQPGFAVTKANAPALAQICAQLDGIPLAIELAASRVRALSPEQILTRLSDRFRLLSGGSRTALPRQRTLRATIDWSHDLLLAAEQVLFRRLSVFVGGWTLEAAEQVCTGSGLDKPTVFETLYGLVNKSLVSTDAGETQVRYSLLETVRQYAHDKLLEANEADSVRVRHLAFYLALAEQAEPYLRRAEQLEWLERLDVERDNLRAALRSTLDTAATAAGDETARLTTSLHHYWHPRGHIREGYAWLERTLAAGEPKPSAVRARALYAYAVFSGEAVGWDRARVWFERALAMAQATGERTTEAYALAKLSIYAVEAGDEKGAGALHAQAVSIFGGLGDIWGQGHSLHEMGDMQTARGNPARAEALLQQALTQYRQTGDRDRIATVLCSLGFWAIYQGELDRATALSQEALAIGRTIGLQGAIVYALSNMALIALRQADYVQAQALFQEREALFDNMGKSVSVVYSQVWRGEVACYQGDYGLALNLQQEALTRLLTLNHQSAVPEVQTSLGLTYLSCGDVTRARDLLEPAVSYNRQRAWKQELALPLYFLARTAYHQGDHARAAVLLEESLVLSRATGNIRVLALTLHGLGQLALAQDETTRAVDYFRESLLLRRRMGARRGIAETLEGFAALALSQQQPERAARLFGAAEALREKIGAPVPLVERAEHERLVAGTLSALNAAAFSSAWQDGRAMDQEQAVMGALGTVGNSSAPTS